MTDSERLYLVALKYEYMCEKFDRTACRQRNRYGIAIPVTGDEHAACTRNALKTRDELLFKYGITHEEFRRGKGMFHSTHPDGATEGVFRLVEHRGVLEKLDQLGETVTHVAESFQYWGYDTVSIKEAMYQVAITTRSRNPHEAYEFWLGTEAYNKFCEEVHIRPSSKEVTYHGIPVILVPERTGWKLADVLEEKEPTIKGRHADLTILDDPVQPKNNRLTDIMAETKYKSGDLMGRLNPSLSTCPTIADRWDREEEEELPVSKQFSPVRSTGKWKTVL